MVLACVDMVLRVVCVVVLRALPMAMVTCVVGVGMANEW